jgi:diguanylate cyclase (GGDEF)-like protein/PAS domain S-box-containing protein
MVPFIVIYRDQDPDVLLQALRDGARDVVSKDDPEHLQLVVTREFENFLIRKELDATKTKLQESEARCTMLIEHSRDAIAYIHDGMHVKANPVYLEMFGYMDLEEIEGLPILDMIAPGSIDQFKEYLRSDAMQEGSIEIQCQNSDGKIFDATLEFSPATIEGESCTQIIIRGSSKDQELEEKLRQLISHDPQTGLANQYFFMERLEAEINETNKDLSLLYISIDNFQQIRSSSGLGASGSLLVEFARLLDQIKADDTLLAHFGDHSFTLLTKQTSEDAAALAATIHQAVADHLFMLASEVVEVTCSIGIAQLDDAVQNSQEFINSAYLACESSQSEGGNGTTVFSHEKMPTSFGDDMNESRMSELIRKALANDRFKLVFQPVVSLAGESREFYSVLTRLIDDNNEEILPYHFIKNAEHAGQMAEVDRWIIGHAINELVTLRAEGRRVIFFISLSASALADENLLLWICDCLRDNNAKGAWVTFQITEADLRQHIQQAKKLIEGLSKIKCQIAIDHYGVSKNSEMLLKHLPINYVRFDPSLIDNLAQSQEKQETLTALNKQAHENGCKTIVMGVEDANSLAMLWTVGVDYIQGYFLQEPTENIAYDFSNS